MTTLGTPILYPVRKPLLGRATYAKHYNAGWACSRRATDRGLDECAYAARHGLSIWAPEIDAYVDGYLDEAHGLRGKWHLRDCRDHTGCTSDHGCQEA